MDSGGYTKFHKSMLDSTIWLESHAVRIVWTTLLLMADADGYVGASVPGLAARARVTLEECEEALRRFLEPDPYSRTPDHDGRRIAEVERGWRILNHPHYRDLDPLEVRRAKDRDRKKKKRANERPRTSADVRGHLQTSAETVVPDAEFVPPDVEFPRTSSEIPTHKTQDTRHKTQESVERASAPTATARGPGWLWKLLELGFAETGLSWPGMLHPIARKQAGAVLERFDAETVELEVAAFAAHCADRGMPSDPWLRFQDRVGSWRLRTGRAQRADRAGLLKERAQIVDRMDQAYRLGDSLAGGDLRERLRDFDSEHSVTDEERERCR